MLNNTTEPFWTTERLRKLPGLLPKKPEFVGATPIDEVEETLRDDASLCFEGQNDESNIDFSKGKFVFAIWQGSVKASSTAYETLEALVDGERHRAGFDFSAFEIVN